MNGLNLQGKGRIPARFTVAAACVTGSGGWRRLESLERLVVEYRWQLSGLAYIVGCVLVDSFYNSQKVPLTFPCIHYNKSSRGKFFTYPPQASEPVYGHDTPHAHTHSHNTHAASAPDYLPLLRTTRPLHLPRRHSQTSPGSDALDYASCGTGLKVPAINAVDDVRISPDDSECIVVTTSLHREQHGIISRNTGSPFAG